MQQLQPLLPYFQSQRGRPGQVTVGSFKLVTRPRSTGSPAVKKTMGIVLVAVFAARTAGVVGATITATWRPIRSASNAGYLSLRPSAQRYSTTTFWPSTKPVDFRPKRNARSCTASAVPSGEP